MSRIAPDGGRPAAATASPGRAEPTPVAFVDDDAMLRRANVQSLELGGFAATGFASAEDALAAIGPDYPGVVVTDIRMPKMDGLQLQRALGQRDADLPVILVTGHGDVEMAVAALQDGAYDFIAKPYPPERLLRSVTRAAEKRRLVLENRALRQRAASTLDDGPLIGETPAMRRLRATLRQIADADVDVLVAGETGSGKEVVARLLHDWSSRRRHGHFVALNCAALPESVIESELFGHESGAFTGAQKKRIGRIEHASGGTLFFDEIESMPLPTQVKLLRVLEGREVAPLGTNDVRPVDLRVVAAAKVDLGDPAQRGDFREDLYYRLNVVTVSIPPLRERRADIPLLFGHFLARAAERFRREVPPIDAGLRRHLDTHAWPGNVRELVHFAERCVLGIGEPEPAAAFPESPSTVAPAGATLPETGALPDWVEAAEGRLIRAALEATGGDVRRTIQRLGIPRKTFYDKLARHGLRRADFEDG
ncbi:sigma-54-dependent transcriptional regulator [Methylobrevis albus]|uniref:Sigma-54-dependent Fis family transcriptional regulator n=1 Tax=Methylobrevis albus TaxID=2793297 RepID=A0A931HZV4_9HYPH|nr:sigma-54 dependent transcriptional regulator [Methylobrevis albus]MBH0237782.1 sigma-54-dependent Fis family transcriptional regulator [Methylobrevis albus]